MSIHWLQKQYYVPLTVKTCDEAIKLYKELSELWGKAGMNQMNQVLKEIPEEDRAI